MSKISSSAAEYQFVEIRDNGDGIVGKGDRVVFRDEGGRRREYGISDRYVRGFLSNLGVAKISGLTVGRAQAYIQYQALRQLAERSSREGNSEELARASNQMRGLAVNAGMTFDRNWSDSLFITAYLNSAGNYAEAPSTMGIIMANAGIGDARHLARILFERGGPDLRAQVRDRAAEIVNRTMENALRRADEAALRGDAAAVDEWLHTAEGFVTEHAGQDFASWSTYSTRADQIRDHPRVTTALLVPRR
ncbi:MAG TPA: hypothetical protein VLJ37_06805 [bacterium]|nr:hypothetical protein [bacterium]